MWTRSGDPPKLCREGKQKLTESPREFLKVSAQHSPEGSLREAGSPMAGREVLPFLRRHAGKMGKWMDYAW